MLYCLQGAVNILDLLLSSEHMLSNIWTYARSFHCIKWKTKNIFRHIRARHSKYSDSCRCHYKRCANNLHEYTNNIIRQCPGKCQYTGYLATPNRLQEMCAYVFLSSPRNGWYSKFPFPNGQNPKMEHMPGCKGHYISKYMCICTLCKTKKNKSISKNCTCHSCSDEECY